MSFPMSPDFSPRLLSNTSTPNDIKDTSLSKKSNYNHTPSPFEKNGYVIRSLLPSPYNKSLVSALSSASCSARSILMHSTPQSVKDQYSRRQHLSTPQSQVKNPFEIALINQLSNSLVSPGIFNMATPKNNENFEWTIDQLATLHPVEINEKPQYKSTFNSALETKAQEAIDQYFNTRFVVLSPIENSSKNEKSVQNENVNTKKSITVGCQTSLTLPLNFNMNKVLGQYMTYEEKKSDAENSQSESFSTASLRRKLFCQEFQESDSSSMGSNMARSDESLNDGELPAPIPTTPDWDRCASANPLSSSPVSHRGRRYKSCLTGEALDYSGTVLSPIHQLSSPLSTRSRSSFRRHSLGSIEDSSKRLFSPCVSPINVESHSSEMASLNISDDVPMESSMKTPVSSPCHKHCENTTNYIKTSCLEGMSPLFSSAKNEIELVSSTKIDSNSIKTTLEEIKVSKEETLLPNIVQIHAPLLSSNIYTTKEMAKIPLNDAQLLCIKVPDAQRKSNISMNFSEMTSVLSTSNNISMMPSKFEVTNVDSMQSVSTSQQDTGYMSYNVGSLPSRSEISQNSKSGFMGTSSLQDIADTDKYIIDQSSHCKLDHASLIRRKLHVEKTTGDKSHLDYADVVERAHKMLNLTPNQYIPPRDKQCLEALLKNTTSYEASNFQWHPIGASTPTHKTLFKPASETVAEILKKAHEDLSQAL